MSRNSEYFSRIQELLKSNFKFNLNVSLEEGNYKVDILSLPDYLRSLPDDAISLLKTDLTTLQIVACELLVEATEEEAFDEIENHQSFLIFASVLLHSVNILVDEKNLE